MPLTDEFDARHILRGCFFTAECSPQFTPEDKAALDRAWLILIEDLSPQGRIALADGVMVTARLWAEKYPPGAIASPTEGGPKIVGVKD